MAAHRYWKVRSPDTHIAGDYLGIAELEMRATVAGADQTTGKTATASANAGSPYFPSAAIDNNASSFWTTGAVAPPAGGHWIMVDFGAGTPVDVLEIAITVRPDTFREDPAELVLEWSDDDVTYTEVIHVSGIAVWTAGLTRTYAVTLVADLRIAKQSAYVPMIRNDLVVAKQGVYAPMVNLDIQVAKQGSYVVMTDPRLHIAKQSAYVVLMPEDDNRRMSLM